jgi:GTPase SAR1 family protein
MEKVIPIVRKDYGFVQQTLYHHPDLYHEQVIDIESPLAINISNDAQMYTFLLMGDQNAGKSTFMHAFTYDKDDNFLELSSYLPILSSNFVNTRFFFQTKENFAAMDELPFLDTDIARVTFQMSAEDFRFFLAENYINETLKPGKFMHSFHVTSCQLDINISIKGIHYVIVQFIEIGGDHLDSIMQLKGYNPDKSPSEISPQLADILKRSYEYMMQSRFAK